VLRTPTLVRAEKSADLSYTQQQSLLRILLLLENCMAFAELNDAPGILIMLTSSSVPTLKYSLKMLSFGLLSKLTIQVSVTSLARYFFMQVQKVWILRFRFWSFQIYQVLKTPLISPQFYTLHLFDMIQHQKSQLPRI